MVKKYVAYYRVSTKKQGVSGLGLDAQKELVEATVGSESVVEEVVEVASGRSRKRAGLQRAVRLCAERNATLIVAKLDRLARDVELLFTMKNNGVVLHACDCGTLDTTTLGIMGTIAQAEGERIRARITEALAARERRTGKRNGQSKGYYPKAATKESLRVRRQIAMDNDNNQKAKAITAMLLKDGKTLAYIADFLNNAGCRTARGKKFVAASVQRLIKLYDLQRPEGAREAPGDALQRADGGER